jgi:hypothetical protein
MFVVSAAETSDGQLQKVHVAAGGVIKHVA